MRAWRIGVLGPCEAQIKTSVEGTVGIVLATLNVIPSSFLLAACVVH